MSCSSYKMLDIDVLHPGKLNVGTKNAQILFIDRKLVHQLDSLTAHQLFSSSVSYTHLLAFKSGYCSEIASKRERAEAVSYTHLNDYPDVDVSALEGRE